MNKKNTCGILIMGFIFIKRQKMTMINIFYMSIVSPKINDKFKRCSLLIETNIYGALKLDEGSD